MLSFLTTTYTGKKGTAKATTYGAIRECEITAVFVLKWVTKMRCANNSYHSSHAQNMTVCVTEVHYG